jgi:uncharacterized protein YqhQ
MQLIFNYSYSASRVADTFISTMAKEQNKFSTITIHFWYVCVAIFAMFLANKIFTTVSCSLSDFLSQKEIFICECSHRPEIATG